MRNQSDNSVSGTLSHDARISRADAHTLIEQLWLFCHFFCSVFFKRKEARGCLFIKMQKPLKQEYRKHPHIESYSRVRENTFRLLFHESPR